MKQFHKIDQETLGGLYLENINDSRQAMDQEGMPSWVKNKERRGGQKSGDTTRLQNAHDAQKSNLPKWVQSKENRAVRGEEEETGDKKLFEELEPEFRDFIEEYIQEALDADEHAYDLRSALEDMIVYYDEIYGRGRPRPSLQGGVEGSWPS